MIYSYITLSIGAIALSSFEQDQVSGWIIWILITWRTENQKSVHWLIHFKERISADANVT